MANTKKVVEETKEVETDVKVEQSVDTNAQILEMMKQMQEQLAQTQAELKAVKEEKETLEKVQTYDTKVETSDKVKLIHMLQGGTSLVTSIGKEIRFEDFNDYRYITKSDLEDLVFGHKFNNIFQNIGVYVCDKSVREEMMLERFYEKYAVNETLFNDMLEMTGDEIMSKLANIPEDLQYSFKMFVVDEHKAGNVKVNREVLSATGDFFKTDIYALLK